MGCLVFQDVMSSEREQLLQQMGYQGRVVNILRWTLGKQRTLGDSTGTGCSEALSLLLGDVVLGILPHVALLKLQRWIS